MAALRGDLETILLKALEALGVTLMLRGSPQLGEPVLRERVEVARNAYPVGHWRTASAVGSMGSCLTALGRFGESEPLLLESYRWLTAAEGEESERTEKAKERLVDLYRAWGKPQRAAALR